MLRGRKIGRYIYGITLVILSCAIVEIVSGIGWLKPIELIYYDLWHLAAGQRAVPENVAIVAVDDQTLLDYRDEPLAFWGPHFAKAIEVLRNAGTRVIGIDFLFSVSAESWLRRIEVQDSELSRIYDIPMRAQLNAGGVVLIALLAQNDRGQSEILMPVADYLYALPGGPSDTGFSNLYLDADGVVRRFLPVLLKGNRFPRQTLADLLARRAAEKARISEKPLVYHAPDDLVSPSRIGFIGPPRTFPKISVVMENKCIILICRQLFVLNLN